MMAGWIMDNVLCWDDGISSKLRLYSLSKYSGAFNHLIPTSRLANGAARQPEIVKRKRRSGKCTS